MKKEEAVGGIKVDEMREMDMEGSAGLTGGVSPTRDIRATRKRVVG